MTVKRQIQHIAIVGAGAVGGGIAQVFATADLDVALADAELSTRCHLDWLRREANDFESQGLFEAGSVDRVHANLRAADADLIVEAVLEQQEINGSVLKSIQAAARPDVIIGTNTSILPIGERRVDAAGLLGLIVDSKGHRSRVRDRRTARLSRDVTRTSTAPASLVGATWLQGLVVPR